MSVATYEGFIDKSGQVRLLEQVDLPINAKVFVVVPQIDDQLSEKPRHIYHIHTPRLANREDAIDFHLQKIQAPS